MQAISLGLFLAMSQLVVTQTTGNCSTQYLNSTGYEDDLTHINATGTTSFTLQQLTGNDQPWYYYLTLTEGGKQGNSSDVLIHPWLGVPESFLNTAQANETRVCMYTMAAQDKGLTNKDGNQTCAGILSDKCVKSVVSPASALSGSGGCPRIDPDKDCPSGGFFASISVALSMATSCYHTSLPGVDMPKGYVAMSFGGIGHNDGEAAGNFSGYDKAVRQSVPSFLKFIQTTVQPDKNTTMSRIAAAQAVCGIPNQVRQGSRPVNSLGGKVELSMLATSVVAMSLLFCFM